VNDNVISLKSRKPLAEEKAQEAAKAEEINQSFLDCQLKILDQLREQVAAGNLANLIVVSRNPHTGLFMHDMVFEPDFDKKSLAFGFTGILEALKMELVDISQLAPTLSADGSLVDPHFEGEIPEEGDW